MSATSYRIGEVAERAGVTPRTLRYYEELGLLAPAGHSPGGARRYSDEDVGRVLRIRELQELMGFDLQAIRRIVTAEARLQQLRAEYRAGVDVSRRREIVQEAIRINDELRAEVRSKLARIEGFLDDLNAKAARYRRLLRETAPVPARS
ncbi:MAG: MerR family transcriptional regulator [Candidatus Velamenicoccus archaeovorus]